MTPEEFLRLFYGANDNESFSVNYRVDKGYKKIESMEIKIAVAQLEKDIKEMKQFFRDYGVDESKAEEAVYFCWTKNHLVKFA